MKTNFKKTLAVLLAVLMLTSVFSVAAFAASTYKVTYKPGAYGVGEEVVDEIASNKTTRIKGALFERPGHIQIGWTTEDGSETNEYPFNRSYTRKRALTLYPVWEVAVEYTITYKPGAGVDGEEYTDTHYTSNILFRDVTYTKPGFIQTGWTTVDGGNNKDYPLNSNSDIAATGLTELVLYPYWEGVEYTVTYHPDANTDGGEKTTQKAKYSSSVALKEALFTREGYVQTGWSLTEGGEKQYDVGKMSDPIMNDLDLYPFWNKKCDVVFAPGAYGVGSSETIIILEGDTAILKGEMFTRDGYTQKGWTTVDGGEKEYDLYQRDVPITKDTVLYPYWVKNVYSLDISKNEIDFGDACEDYIPSDTVEIVITNTGNVPVNLGAGALTNFDFALVSGSVNLDVGATVTVALKPKSTLTLGDYNEALEIVILEDNTKVYTVNLKLTVTEHIYGEYESANDATYTQPGHIVAECVKKGCDHKDYILIPDSVKKYSADNNDAVGLEPSYIHHRTVRFTAFGSGMDAAEEDKLTKRFRPVSWYVNDEFNGEFTGNQFENGYDVTFTHTIFGKYTLIINYVEEELDATTGEWVATEVTDTKTFEYTVGTTAEEEQEIVRPNTILSIIFGLFAELLKLLGIGG